MISKFYCKLISRATIQFHQFCTRRHLFPTSHLQLAPVSFFWDAARLAGRRTRGDCRSGYCRSSTLKERLWVVGFSFRASISIPPPPAGALHEIVGVVADVRQRR